MYGRNCRACSKPHPFPCLLIRESFNQIGHSGLPFHSLISPLRASQSDSTLSKTTCFLLDYPGFRANNQDKPILYLTSSFRLLKTNFVSINYMSLVHIKFLLQLKLNHRLVATFLSFSSNLQNTSSNLRKKGGFLPLSSEVK